jgi:hypothetical protein
MVYPGRHTVGNSFWWPSLTSDVVHHFKSPTWTLTDMILKMWACSWWWGWSDRGSSCTSMGRLILGSCTTGPELQGMRSLSGNQHTLILQEFEDAFGLLGSHTPSLWTVWTLEPTWRPKKFLAPKVAGRMVAQLAHSVKHGLVLSDRWFSFSETNRE